MDTGELEAGVAAAEPVGPDISEGVVTVWVQEMVEDPAQVVDLQQRHHAIGDLVSLWLIKT